VASQDLLSRQRQAVYALLFQGIALSMLGAVSAIKILGIVDYGPEIAYTPSMALFAFGIFCIPALVPFALGFRLYHGRLTKWAYEGWAGVSFSFGVFFMLLLLTTMPVWSPFMVDAMGLLTLTVTLSFLLATWAILRLTSLY
jgi:hypothetical protein